MRSSSKEYCWLDFQSTLPHMSRSRCVPLSAHLTVSCLLVKTIKSSWLKWMRPCRPMERTRTWEPGSSRFKEEWLFYFGALWPQTSTFPARACYVKHLAQFSQSPVVEERQLPRPAFLRSDSSFAIYKLADLGQVPQPFCVSVSSPIK
jgi:hypothetical protein